MSSQRVENGGRVSGAALRRVYFVAAGALWLHTPTGGLAQIAVAGDPNISPPPNDPPNISQTNYTPLAVNNTGQLVFKREVWGDYYGTSLYRFTPQQPSPFEIVAYNGQPVSGVTVGGANNATVSMNNSGAVTFRAGAGGGKRAIFQQAPAIPSNPSTPPVVLVMEASQSQTVPVAGGGTYGLQRNLATRTLDDNSVQFFADILDGQALLGTFLITAGTVRTIVSTADILPAGSRISTRGYVGYAGKYVLYFARRTGGSYSYWLYDVNTGTNTRIVLDGDAAPGTSGKLKVVVPGWVNSSGQAVFTARVLGAAAYGTGIFLKPVNGPVAKVAVVTDQVEVSPGNFKKFTSFALPYLRVPPLNALGQVVFFGYLNDGNDGIFVGTAGASAAKIVMSSEAIPGSNDRYFADPTWFNAWPAINRLGEVAFQGLIQNPDGSTSDGFFVGAPGGAMAKVVGSGDPGPMGSTFPTTPLLYGLMFNGLAFNDAGEVGFTSALNGYPFGGLFVGTTLAPPQAVVLDGDPAPVLGDYSIKQPTLEVAMNARGDLAFRALLTGGLSDSGYFLRRSQTVKPVAVVVRGQAVPGTTSGAFSTIWPSLSGYPEEEFMLAENGDFVFTQEYQEGGSISYGLFRYSNGQLSKIFLRGDNLSQAGGAISLMFINGVGVNEAGRTAFWARLTGGTIGEAIFVEK